MRKGCLVVLCVLFFLSSAVYARYSSSRVVIHGTTQLANEISRVVLSHPGANVGIYIKSMKYGDTLYAQNINRPFVPASILKILTAESALLYLGPEYRFNTRFMTDAKSIDDGVLTGNLYLVQSGDPSLTYYDLVSLMSSLKSQQIDSVAGNVYIDNSAFDQIYTAPGWIQKDARYRYAAPISASIINRNYLAFKIMPARKAGQMAHVMTSPHYYYPVLRNTVVTKPKHSKGCYLKLSSFSDGVLSLHGCMPKGNYAWGVGYVVENVLTYNQSLVKTLFRRYGVHVKGRIAPGKALANYSPVVSHQSQPLRFIVNEMMKKSDNVIAGALFKKLGQTYSNQPGSWENGSTAVENILSTKLGINTKGLHVVDGSGLSRYNQVSPLQMMQVLDFAFHNKGTNIDFISALPIAGIDGTLKHRLYNVSRQIRAKTGTISGVVSLAGYAMSNDKEPIAFVIIVNSRRGTGWIYRDLEDKIATLLTQYQR